LGFLNAKQGCGAQIGRAAFRACGSARLRVLGKCEEAVPDVATAALTDQFCPLDHPR
jgi:hypothetical protein